MKITIVDDLAANMARGQLAITVLTLAAQKLGWQLTDNSNDADLVIVIGKQLPINLSITNQPVSQGQPEEIFANPELFLLNAKSTAKPMTSIVDNPPTKAVSHLSSTTESPNIIRLLAVTACPTGVAHTFMAAEAIETEAKRRGWPCKVETRGSVGAGNVITPEEIAEADLVIIAADIDVDVEKFAGKRMYRTSTGAALKRTAQEFDKALQQATIYTPQSSNATPSQSVKKNHFYSHLLTGISYMLPMVVAGGLLIALSFAFGRVDAQGQLIQAGNLKMIGDTAFQLMVPLLAGYIAFAIADRPGLVPGLVSGMLATTVKAGFLGGIVGGYLAGYVALLLVKGIRLPQSFNSLKPILLIPLIATLISGLVMLYVIGSPIAQFMAWLTEWLKTINAGNAAILGMILGAMMCIDMGGPINKVAYAFGTGLISAGQFMPMAAIMGAGMVPPLAMAIATWLARSKFSASEKDSGLAAFVLGLCFISEGAIPFAGSDPARVLPISAIGGAITGGLSMYYHVELMAPHGGLFVLAIPSAVTHVMSYLIAIALGAVVAGILYAIAKRPTVKVV